MDGVAQSTKAHIRNRNTAATYPTTNTHAAKSQFGTKISIASRTSQHTPHLPHPQTLTNPNREHTTNPSPTPSSKRS
jgi:hypothetical protein